MASFTIDEFWIPRLGKRDQARSHQLVQGWSFEQEGLATFQEAPITLSVKEFDEGANPSSSSILLVSAPGAVGKSTLARQIASTTGSVYVDLAKAEPVGGNTLSGGLARSDLYAPWTDGTLSVLIDGLDEALLRTTKEGFEAFVKDVATLSQGRAAPTVLFGRTGVVEDVWIVLDDLPGVKVAVLAIGYYGPEESVEFADATLKSRCPDRQHTTVDREALGLLLDGLRSQTESDGDRFAGYAPVLQAVAERVASETNPSVLVSQLTQGQQEQTTLQSVVRDILKREQDKLDPLRYRDATLAEKLYSPDEQLDRLVSHVYEVPQPELPPMLPEDRETYSNALQTWVGTHPFLGGGRPETQSAVFQAAISARALKSTAAGQMALRKELDKGDAANPFLYTFYMDEDIGLGHDNLQEEHIGCFYSSLRASLAHGESANLTVEELEEDSEKALVEIELYRASESSTVLEFNSGVLGPIRLGAHVKDVFVNMPQAGVEIGQGSEVILVAPVEIQCNNLVIYANRLIAQSPPEYEQGSVVLLRADKLLGPQMSTVPVIRGNVELLASWPGVNQYPWNSYAADLKPKNSLTPDDVLEGLRRFRKFVISCQSHGNRRLAKSSNKMESGRMTKGSGQKVLNYMLAKNVVSKEGQMYILNTSRLAELTGATYVDVAAYRFEEQAIDFVHEALDS